MTMPSQVDCLKTCQVLGDSGKKILGELPFYQESVFIFDLLLKGIGRKI